MTRRLVFVLALALGTLPFAAGAQTHVRSGPGGKVLAFVDGNDIRTAPGGTRLLFVDGSSIRQGGPGGARVLFVDGDSIRPEPGGVRVAFMDGGTLRREPGGKILLVVKHPDISPDAASNRVYFLDGPALSRPHLLAVLYHLRPDLFKLSAGETATRQKAMADVAKEEAAEAKKDHVAGTYGIASFSSSDGRKRKGKVVVEKKGDL